MWYPDGYEMKPDNRASYEEIHQEGRRCVIAESDKAFRVFISVPQAWFKTHGLLLATLKSEGRHPGWCAHLAPTASSAAG